MRLPLTEKVANSPRCKREPLHSLAVFENFSRFQSQDEHKRFVKFKIQSLAHTKPNAKIRIDNGIAKFIFANFATLN